MTPNSPHTSHPKPYLNSSTPNARQHEDFLVQGRLLSTYFLISDTPTHTVHYLALLETQHMPLCPNFLVLVPIILTVMQLLQAKPLLSQSNDSCLMRTDSGWYLIPNFLAWSVFSQSFICVSSSSFIPRI